MTEYLTVITVYNVIHINPRKGNKFVIWHG